MGTDVERERQRERPRHKPRERPRVIRRGRDWARYLERDLHRGRCICLDIAVVTFLDRCLAKDPGSDL